MNKLSFSMPGAVDHELELIDMRYKFDEKLINKGGNNVY